jgi:predicted nucleic acid-binding Zn ribbon protein
MTARKGKPQRVGETLAKFLGDAGLAARVEQAGIIPEWPSLVGAQIATVTDPHHIARDGTLFVAVKTNAWMQELSLLEPQLLKALNARAGRARIVRIHWQLMR